MIAAWMLHLLTTALMLGLAALALEALLRVLGRPVRWAWVGALALSLLLPAARIALAALAPLVSSAPGAVAGGPDGIAADAAIWTAIMERADLGVVAGPAWQRMDAPLLALWLSLSVAVAGWSLTGVMRLWRARREWAPRTVQGVPVLVSGRTGPALAGLFRPRVVLPEWALEGDPGRLRLMLAHEREHQRARDPWMLAAGATMAVLLPWNPITWWQLRRLRLAVEMDCDARVLRQHADVRGYGALLLDVGRLTAGPRLPLAALGTPPSTLERRIRAMTMESPRHPRLLGFTLAGVVAALALAACEVPRPTEITPEHELPLAKVRSEGDLAPADADRVTLERVRAVLEESEPGLLAERTGKSRTLWIVEGVDAEGRAVGSAPSVHLASPPSVVPGDIESVEIIKTAPGRLLPDSAGVIWVRLKEGSGSGAESEARQVVVGRALELADSTGAARVSVLRRAPAAPSDAQRAAAGRRVRVVQGVLVRPDSASSTGEALLRGDTLRGTLRGTGEVVVLRTPGTPLRAGSRLQAGERVRIEGDTLRLRGVSMGDGPRPLMVLDGVILTGTPDIAPERIRQVEVIKGEAAARIYGERGANGVIIITTKTSP